MVSFPLLLVLHFHLLPFSPFYTSTVLNLIASKFQIECNVDFNSWELKANFAG